MKPHSIIKKGKRLEQRIAAMWRRKIDDFATRTSGSGSGHVKADVYNRYFAIEAKNQEKVKLWEWWRQAGSQVQFNKPPVLMISGNYRPILAVMDINDWLDLVKEAKIDKPAR